MIALTLSAFGGSAVAFVSEQGASTTATERRDARIREFYDQARAIIRENQNLELSLDEARRRVNKLHKEMSSWSKQFDVELSRRSRTYNHNPEAEKEPASTDLCPLFFAEELDELCPLDATRSEVWGARTVHCRYECLK